MKTNFKKLASSAAVTAALATGSMSVHAVITDVPGEAYLVPFAVATVGDAARTSQMGAVDTVVRIVVPASIGVDTVFSYTAPHTSPTNQLAGGGNTELPEAAALNGGNLIHWTFLDRNSSHVINGDFPVTADDVVVFDWQSIVRQNEGLLNNVAGYLVFQTEAGWQGRDADFSFFADAYFVTDAVNRRDGGEYNDFFASANIPALPMADGADAGQSVPNLGNNVIVDGGTLGVDASPLVSGIRTSIPGATDELTLVDLELVAANSRRDSASLMVVWNDTNATTWRSTGYQAYDNNEQPCSGTLSLPNELNLLWSAARRGQRGGPSEANMINYDMLAPGFITSTDTGGSAVQTVNLCNPNTVAISSFTEDRLNGGFVKLRLNEPSNTRQHSAAAFTINLGSTIDNGLKVFATETVLGHDRGKFNKAR